MNLHIVPDNVFINKFYENLRELGALPGNRIIVRTSADRLRFIKHDLPYAKLYSPAFRRLCGETASYERVFIHQFTPLLYRWVATADFREVNWMVWGADLYNLPMVDTPLYEELTSGRYVRKRLSYADFLYRLKVSMLHQRYAAAAYKKVRHILTWMTTEYEFARRHLPVANARHKFFFYENQLPYQELDNTVLKTPPFPPREVPLYVLGNSSTPELNHMDAVAWMEREGLRADLVIPVSYGDRHYAAFLKRNLAFYKGGALEFVDRYMDIAEYLHFLYRSDGLIMNNIRPQGYGNIFMMMYLGKKVFLNEKNLSGPELTKRKMVWFPLRELSANPPKDLSANRSAVLELLSHETLLNVYAGLFTSQAKPE